MIEILKDRALLHLTGLDVMKFLQGMTTNNIAKNTYSYNYLLTNQGKYLFDFFVYKQNDNSYFLDIYKGDVDNLFKRLMLYKLRSDVKIEDVSSGYNILYSKSELKSFAECSFQDPRYSELGYRSIILSSNVALLSENEMIEDLYITDKYKYTIIDGFLDLLYDRSIAVEYGAEELNAIDYKKGCYVGQEVVSRVKYQGVVRKKIFKLNFDSKNLPTLAGKEVLDLNGDKIGSVCSSYKNQAMALIREEKYLNLEKKIALVGTNEAIVEVPEWRK